MRIKELRMAHNMLQHELAEKLNVAQNTLSYWESEKYQPDISALISMARIFNVSIDYLIGLPNDINSNELNSVEKKIISFYRELNNEGKDKLLDYADDLVQSQKYIKNSAGSMAN